MKNFRYYGQVPLVPEAPAQPVDYLFMVKAIAHGLSTASRRGDFWRVSDSTYIERFPSRPAPRSTE